MLKFYADFFMRACVRLDRLQTDPSEDYEWRTHVEHYLIMLEGECTKIGFSDSFGDPIHRILGKVKRRVTPGASVANSSRPAVCGQLEALSKSIEKKLHESLFFKVMPERMMWYSDEDEALFSKEVHLYVPKASHSIAEAGRCFALERWDACVHHLMVATEMALHQWARSLRVKTKTKIEIEDWEKIRKAAKEKLAQLTPVRRTIKGKRRIEFLSDTLDHFDYIRDARRNPSAHGRKRYDDKSAGNLLHQTGEFLKRISNPKAFGGP